jgi:hypothetical protein
MQQKVGYPLAFKTIQPKAIDGIYPLPEKIFMMMRCLVFQVPSGTSENNPALQRWVPDLLFSRPGGTVVGFADVSAVPPGRIVYDRLPTVETVGYFQTVPPGRNGPLKKKPLQKNLWVNRGDVHLVNSFK